MIAAALLSLVPVLPAALPPLATPAAAMQRGGKGWGLMPFPDGGYTGTRRPWPSRGGGKAKPKNVPPPPRGTGGYKGPGDTAGPGKRQAGPSAAPMAPAQVPGSNTDAPVMAVTPDALPDLLDLDEWSLWWRLHYEGYTAVEPWQLEATGSDGFFIGRGEKSEAEGPGISQAVIYGRIVPALLTALDNDPSEALRTGAMLSLARIGATAETSPSSEEMLAKFVDQLDDKNQRIAETACIAIGILAVPESLQPLTELLLDSEAGRASLGRHEVPRRVRAFAAYGLGLVARDAGPELRAQATRALVASLAAQPGSMPDERIAAVVALSMIDPRERENEGLAERLLELLAEDDENLSTRSHVPAALATIAPFLEAEAQERVLDELLDTATRKTERDLLRAGCVIALGRLADSDEDKFDAKVRKALMKVTTSGSYRERSYALIALAQIGARAGTGKGDPHDGTVDIQKFFLKQLAHSKQRERPWYGLALGLLARHMRDAGDAASADAKEEMRDALRAAKSPNERVAFAVALGLAGDADAVEGLLEELDELDPAMRGDVALAIGMTGSTGAIQALSDSLSAAQHEPHSLQNTARALALLGDTNVVTAVQALGEECDCALSHQGMALALGRTRHPNAVAPLLALLEGENSSELERGYAALGLGYAADKDTTAWSYRISADVHYRAYATTLTSEDLSGILDLP